MLKISNSQRYFEIITVLLTGLLKFVLMDYFDQKLLYISIAILFWFSYILFRTKQNKALFSYWGFSKKNLKESFKFLAPIALVSIFAFLLIGIFTKQAIFSWHIFPILLIYPLWGIIQQFLIMSLFAGNLADQTKSKISKSLLIVLTAILFGLLHLPYTLLAIGTSLLALVYTHSFLKYRNLWLLGLFHGILGALFYYLVLGRDTYEEVFSVLFN